MGTTSTTAQSETTRRQGTGSDPLDVLIIGGGNAGLYLLHRIRERGLSVVALEAGSSVGGVWYWNRYPGARLDSESYTYGYFFSEELLRDWRWSEEFVGQEELESYFKFVATKFGLWKDIRLDSRAASMEWIESRGVWLVKTVDGSRFEARTVVTAVGILSAPQYPEIPGRDRFEGESHHTGLWPKEEVDFAGKRIAVIGTGSSGVQVIPFAAAVAEQLVVFQRTPNWCTPINNSMISTERAEQLVADSAGFHRYLMSASASGYLHAPRDEDAFAVTTEQRIEHFERLYAQPGLSMMFANFRDILTNRAANEALSDFIAQKIRGRVHDPLVAEKLIPRDHGYGMKRPPLEDRYYEVYNQGHVTLVDTTVDPIVAVTKSGIQTETTQHALDMIVYATGFDAVTGALQRIEVTGAAGHSLTDAWSDGPRSYLGVQIPGFPNLFTIGGPQSAAGNVPRFLETQVDWLVDLLGSFFASGAEKVETTDAAADEWGKHNEAMAQNSLLRNAQSWAFGSNTPGKPRTYLLYAGGQDSYRKRLAEVVESGYSGFLLDGREWNDPSAV